MSKREYYKSKFEIHKHDTTAMWKFLKKIAKTRLVKIISPKMILAMVRFSTQKSLANHFN